MRKLPMRRCVSTSVKMAQAYVLGATEARVFIDEIEGSASQGTF